VTRCRICKKRPVPDRSERRKDEPPEVTESLAKVRKVTDTLCWECANVFMSARMDQTIAYMREKSRLGQCIVKDCAEPVVENERCLGHQIKPEDDEA
jgi:hypothetical protein